MTIYSQIVNIPDNDFKFRLLNVNTVDTNNDNNPDAIADTNGDGEIQVSEALAVERLFADCGARDFTGIEAFTNLKFLLFTGDRNLTKLDLSQNTQLEILTTYSGNANFEAPGFLNLDNLINLESAALSETGLETIDLSDCVALDRIFLDKNQLTSIDFSNNPALTKADIGDNPLNSVNISNNPNLEELDIFHNNNANHPLGSLTSVDVSNCPNLIKLDLNQLEINQLDVSNNFLLEELSISRNNLTELDLSNNALLTRLSMNNSTSLTSLIIKNGAVSPPLDSFWFSTSNIPNLTSVCVDADEITSVTQFLSTQGYNNLLVDNSCNATPGGFTNKVKGVAKFDIANNGCDMSDPPIGFLKYDVSINGTSYSFRGSSDGNFEIPFPQGNFNIQPTFENPSWFNATPATIPVSFTTNGEEIIQDICANTNIIKHDVEVTIIGTTTARPGFDSNYRIYYNNKGSVAASGTISINYDRDLVQFNNSTTTPLTQSPGRLSFSFSNLLPFETREIELNMILNSPMDTPALNDGDVLYFAANITEGVGVFDETILDNTVEYEQDVVNSHDPNDIACLSGKNLNPSMVGEYVKYLIRFENVGSASAVNIIVKNTINPLKFDISTLTPLYSSHPMITSIENNKALFSFNNIFLDFNDATNDGYLIYKIKTLPNLQLGDTFSNQAEIYFDFNFPIITNDYMVTVAQTASIDDVNLNTVKLYPNPANDTVNITSQSNIKAIKIFDHLGRIVKRITLVNEILEKSINLSNLKTGLYFVEVEDKNGKQTVKLAKE